MAIFPGFAMKMTRSFPFVLSLAAVLAGLGVWAAPGDDFDLGWHLLGGQWIFDHHTVPTRDFINPFNPGWHDYHWLAELFLYQIFRIGGFPALRVFHGLLIGCVGWVMAGIVRDSTPRATRLSSAAALAFGLILLLKITDIRPQMISVLLIAIAMRRLRKPEIAWELPFLFGLTVILVSVHVNWVFIPFLWAAYRCFGRAAAPAPKRWVGLALLSGAGFISPYTFTSPFGGPPLPLINYALLWEYTQVPAGLKERIMELKGVLAIPDPISWLVLGVLILLGRTASVRAVSRGTGDWIVGCTGLFLAVLACKFDTVLAIFVLPVLSRSLVPCEWALLRSAHTRGVSPRRIAGLLTGGAVLAALWLGIQSFRSAPWMNRDDRRLEQSMPLQACDAIARLPLTPTLGRHFIFALTHFNHGGWCRWKLFQTAPEKDIRVSTDGRLQWLPPGVYFSSFDLFELKNRWEETLKRWGPDVALVPKSLPLEILLRQRPADWKLVYEDDMVGLFISKDQFANFESHGWQ